MRVDGWIGPASASPHRSAVFLPPLMPHPDAERAFGGMGQAAWVRRFGSDGAGQGTPHARSRRLAQSHPKAPRAPGIARKPPGNATAIAERLTVTVSAAAFGRVRDAVPATKPR